MAPHECVRRLKIECLVDLFWKTKFTIDLILIFTIISWFWRFWTYLLQILVLCSWITVKFQVITSHFYQMIVSVLNSHCWNVWTNFFPPNFLTNKTSVNKILTSATKTQSQWLFNTVLQNHVIIWFNKHLLTSVENCHPKTSVQLFVRPHTLKLYKINLWQNIYTSITVQIIFFHNCRWKLNGKSVTPCQLLLILLPQNCWYSSSENKVLCRMFEPKRNWQKNEENYITRHFAICILLVNQEWGGKGMQNGWTSHSTTVIKIAYKCNFITKFWRVPQEKHTFYWKKGEPTLEILFCHLQWIQIVLCF